VTARSVLPTAPVRWKTATVTVPSSPAPINRSPVAARFQTTFPVAASSANASPPPDATIRLPATTGRVSSACANVHVSLPADSGRPIRESPCCDIPTTMSADRATGDWATRCQTRPIETPPSSSQSVENKLSRVFPAAPPQAKTVARTAAALRLTASPPCFSIRASQWCPSPLDRWLA